MASENSRFAGKPWWQMPVANTGSTIQPLRTRTGLAGKGELGGECQRIACENHDAHWFNETNGRYYCASCARTFNEICRRNGQEPLCELHPGVNPPGNQPVAQAEK
jgi:hypothetical protein